MNKLTQNAIEYGIEKGYQFIYRFPEINSKNEYIDMYVYSENVNINSIFNKVKEHLEDQNQKVITLIFKG